MYQGSSEEGMISFDSGYQKGFNGGVKDMILGLALKSE